MSDANEFWLQTWIKEFDVSSNGEFKKAAKSPTAIKRLFSLATEKSSRNLEEHATKLPAYSVLAGRSLDLSGAYHHSCTKCLSTELSMLLARTMHFFDRAIVSGPSVTEVASGLQHKNLNIREKTLWNLKGQVEFINYINKIGAADTVTYAPKIEAYCDACFHNWAKRAGISALESEEQSEKIVEQLLNEAKFITIRDRTGNWTSNVTHPNLIGGTWSRRRPYSRRPTRKKVAWDLFYGMSRPTIYDLSTAQHYKVPLLDAYQVKWMATDSSRGKASADDVALELRIPQLSGLPLEDLIRIKQEERDHLVRFQQAISAAIREMVSKREMDSPSTIAAAVVREYIEPEIAAMEARMKSKQRAFGKKLASAAALGTLVTTVGAIQAVPLVLATGVAAAATSLTQLYKYFDDKSEIETSDLYFISRLSKIKH
ncbi:hypothetical protein [Amycolatopsis sp. WAC 04182]|nr:hypothetical protein [Amycolatopsis sp. WAC 04182]